MFVELVLKGGEHIVEAAFFARSEVFAAFAVVVTSAVTVVAAGVLVELLTACIFAVVFSLALFGELGLESACLLDRKVDALLSRSTPITLTFTVSPTLSASPGCLMKRSEISEICTSPS